MLYPKYKESLVIKKKVKDKINSYHLLKKLIGLININNIERPSYVSPE